MLIFLFIIAEADIAKADMRGGRNSMSHLTLGIIFSSIE